MFADTHLRELGQFVRESRMAIGLSQKDIKELTGLNENTLRKIENGKVVPKFETLEILSSLLKMDFLHHLRQFRSNPIIMAIYNKIDYVFILEKDDALIELMLLEKLLLNSKSSFNLVNPNELKQLTIFIQSSIKYLDDNQENLPYIDNVNVIDNIVKVLQLSNSNFELDSYYKHRYTPFEIRILLLIGLFQVKIKKFDLSTSILIYCLNFLDDLYENDYDILKLKIKLYYNISYNYHNLDKHELALKYSNLGIDAALKQDFMFRLPFLIARKGIAEYYLDYPIAQKSFEDTLYLLKLTHDYDNYQRFLKIFETKYDYKNPLNE